MASVAGAIADWLLGDATLTGQLGGSFIYRDEAPETAAAGKYVTITEGVSVVPFTYDSAATELVQIDLWQPKRDASGAVVEQPAISRQIQSRLDRAVIQGGPTGQFSTEVEQTNRFYERDTGLVHHALTVRVIRAV